MWYKVWKVRGQRTAILRFLQVLQAFDLPGTPTMSVRNHRGIYCNVFSSELLEVPEKTTKIAAKCVE